MKTIKLLPWIVSYAVWRAFISYSPKRWLSFNLTGILYFPKLGSDLQIQKDKIQLYQNQVYVTDNVEGIVPEF
jgi:HSP90 family molecular chaperone